MKELRLYIGTTSIFPYSINSVDDNFSNSTLLSDCGTNLQPLHFEFMQITMGHILSTIPRQISSSSGIVNQQIIDSTDFCCAFFFFLLVQSCIWLSRFAVFCCPIRVWICFERKNLNMCGWRGYGQILGRGRL